MSRFIDVVLLLVIVTISIHNANLQSLDYDYSDREFRRTIPFQGIVRMPMSDIGAQQRAQLSMIATNSEPFFDRRSQWSRYEPPQSTVNQKETMWWKSWPRQLPISTIPSSHVSGMGLPSQPVVPSMMVVPIEPVVTQPSILNSALMTVFGNASDNKGTTAQKPLTAFLNSFPVDKFFRALNTNSANKGAGEATEETVNGITTTVAMPLTGGPGLKPASIMDLFGGGGGGTESGSVTPQKPTELVGAERPTQERNGGSLFGIEKLLGLAGGMTVDKAQTIPKPSVESPITASIEQPTDPGDNLLGSILNGHFGEIDWIGSLLGTKQTPSQEEGNAMAQLFKGGFFGPADDSV